MAICIPEGIGVPIPTGPNSYTMSGPPIWWDTTSGPMTSFNTSLEDPRWMGSAGVGYPDVSSVVTDHAAFRAVHATDSIGITTTYLYLSWVLKVDPSVGSGSDSVLVGFFRPGMMGSPGVAFRITPTNVPSAKTAEAPLDVDVYTRSATGTWQAVPAGTPDPSWITNFARVWVDPSATRRYPWAVQLRIPLQPSANLNDGIDLQSAFRMRFQVNSTKPDGTAAFYRWPRAAPLILGADFGDPTGTSWDDFQLSSGACAGGVSVVWGDVGTFNTPSHEIQFRRVNPPTNTFYVKPRNGMSTTIPPSTNPNPPNPGVKNLSARFRIANWGSTPTGGTAGLWIDIPEGSDVRNVPIPAVTTGEILPGTQGEMRFNWQVLDPILGEFENGTRRPHQCVLVELSGPNLTFTKSSVFQNMTVMPASMMQQKADISIQGLGSAGGTHRDVYVYVQTLNMPSTLRPPERPREERPPPVNVAGGEISRLDEDGEPPVTGPVGPPLPSWEQERRPVYLVHVWHATGETATDADGATWKVLEPQTSFGYYIEHQGPLFGWDHKLTGHGLVEIAPNFYKVAIPNDGSVTVGTEISALETPTDLRSLLAWLLALLRALWRAIVRAIRKLFGS
jgi:hypothetical protein